MHSLAYSGTLHVYGYGGSWIEQLNSILLFQRFHTDFEY